jgi:hypothetical protein
LAKWKRVRDSFDRAATFRDRLGGPVKVEQVQVSQPRRHEHVGRFARHSAPANSHLHDADAGGHHFE